ncbi:MAG: hypothetical protein MZV64_00135 [Ignavibacteriales bacterium]|nr:hypothetical protein [Ignavibacteriales bacterium]
MAGTQSAVLFIPGRVILSVATLAPGASAGEDLSFEQQELFVALSGSSK